MKPFVLAARARWLRALMITWVIVAIPSSPAIAEDVPSKSDLPTKPRPGSAASRPAPSKVAASPEDAVIKKLEFKQANMLDVVRALADMSGLNIVATEDAAKKNVTVFLQDVTVKDALDTITKNSGLWYRQDKTSKAYRIMTTDEYQRDMVVYREDTTRVFKLMHPNPMIVATAIRDVFPNRVQMTLGIEDSTAMGGLGGAAGGAMGASSGLSATSTANAGIRQATARQVRNGGIGTAGNVGNAAAGAGRQSELVVSEKLTADQLEKLDVATKGGSMQAVSSDELSKISGREQPIYITLNREHNLIIVRTSDNAVMKDIEKLISEMDKPTAQVMLEMKILALELGDSYKQAFDMDFMPSSKPVRGPYTNQSRNPLSTPAEHTVTDTVTTTVGTGGNTRTITDTASGNYALGVGNILGLGNFALEGGTFVYQFMNDKIRARIQLLAENHKINTLSSPILLASNNKPARVFVGQEQIVTTGFEAVGGAVAGTTVTAPAIIPVTEVRNIGNTLQIMPKINSDKSVTLLIQQDSSSVIPKGASIPIPVGGTTQYFDVDTVKTSNMQGTVVAKDGLTVAIGGLIDSSTSNSVQKVPILGDLPVVGELFKRKVEGTSKRELILLITPHIISTPGEGEDVTVNAVKTISEQDW